MPITFPYFQEIVQIHEIDVCFPILPILLQLWCIFVKSTGNMEDEDKSVNSIAIRTFLLCRVCFSHYLLYPNEWWRWIWIQYVCCEILKLNPTVCKWCIVVGSIWQGFLFLPCMIIAFMLVFERWDNINLWLNEILILISVPSI